MILKESGNWAKSGAQRQRVILYIFSLVGFCQHKLLIGLTGSDVNAQLKKKKTFQTNFNICA